MASTELQPSAGLRITNPTPVDAYYMLPQVGQAAAQPYADDADACTHVPQPVRYDGLTVNVDGVEKCWRLADLSDAGLQLKTNGGIFIGELGTNGAGILITSGMVQSSGEVYVPVPTDATGLVDLFTHQPLAVGQTVTTPIPLVKPDWLLVPGELRIAAGARVRLNDVLVGTYYVQESTAPRSPSNPFGLGLISLEGLVQGTLVGGIQQYLVDRTGFWNAYIDSRVTVVNPPNSFTASQVSDFAEAVQDSVAALLVQGANTTLTYNDVANTLTIASTGGSSSSGTALFAQAWVDVSGNDSTAVVGQQGKPFLTIDAALLATASAGYRLIWVGMGVFQSPTPANILANTVIVGSGRPGFDWVVTGAAYPGETHTTPTALVGGTILQNMLGVPATVSNIRICHLGVDVGSAWCAAHNGGQPAEGLLFPASFTAPQGSQNGRVLRTNVILHDIAVLQQNPYVSHHAMAIENCYEPIVYNIQTWGGFAGIVTKNVGGRFSGLLAMAAGSFGIIVKLNDYATSVNTLVTDWVIRDGAGLTLTNESGDGGLGFGNCQVSNGRLVNTTYGVVQVGSNLHNWLLSNIHINDTAGKAIDLPDFNDSVINQVHVNGATTGFDVHGYGTSLDGITSMRCSALDATISSPTTGAPLVLRNATSKSTNGVAFGTNCRTAANMIYGTTSGTPVAL